MMELPEVDVSGIVLPQKGAPEYDIRAIYNYCKANDRNANELTEEELKQFIIGEF